MRSLVPLLLLALLGCGPYPEPPPAPPSSPPVRLEVDASDFVEWGSGGGIDGRWSGVRVWGDGRVQVLEGPGEAREGARLEPARAARLLQAAVDAGLLDLVNHPPTGADMLGRGIQAELDGRKVSASIDEMTRDPAWDRVWAVLRLPERR